jgi:hypothetical protein
MRVFSSSANLVHPAWRAQPSRSDEKTELSLPGSESCSRTSAPQKSWRLSSFFLPADFRLRFFPYFLRFLPFLPFLLLPQLLFSPL